jgi:dCTP deaminase
MLLSDVDIRKLCTVPLHYYDGRPLIDPFHESVSLGVVSYGLSHAGYDLRLDNRIWVFRNTRGEAVDPKLFRDASYRDRMFDCYQVELGQPVIVPGHSYALVQSLETIAVPPRLKGRCVGKSTYARCGLIVNTTPLEPCWWGKLTIELSNANPCPVRLYTGEGIAQLEFEELSSEPFVTYASKGGKYQGQDDVTPARVL